MRMHKLWVSGGCLSSLSSVSMKWGKLPCLIWVTFSTSDTFLFFSLHSLALPSFSSSPLCKQPQHHSHPILTYLCTHAQPFPSRNGWWTSSPDFLHWNSGVSLAFLSLCSYLTLIALFSSSPVRHLVVAVRAQQCKEPNHIASQHLRLFSMLHF